MDALKAVEMFKHGVLNEIYHSSADEALKDALVSAVKDVEKTVVETINALKKK